MPSRLWLLPLLLLQLLLLYTISVHAAGNACDAEPCINDAECIATDDGFSCRCHFGWGGTLCDTISYDACATTPCNNGATCIPLGGVLYTCTCVTGYSGDTCDIISAAISLGGPNPRVTALDNDNVTVTITGGDIMITHILTCDYIWLTSMGVSLEVLFNQLTDRLTYLEQFSFD